MKKWSKTLREIQAVLKDAEQKQLTNEEVKLWLDDLHELAYDIEDIFDELTIEAQSETTTRARTSRSMFAKVKTSAVSLVKCKLKPDHQMKTKIEDISSRLKDVFERKKNMGLQLNSNIVVGERVILPSRQTTSLPPTRVFGREKEKEEIVEMLMKPEPDSAEVPVITIVGMGGMGKTTLAQDIYHDESVVKCFDLKAWVCVSDVFDVAGITRTILASRSSGDKLENFDLNKLQEELKQMLSGKKFLLVLDDIWNENYGEWDVLRRPFRFGAAGSRILATTRNKRVASTMSRTNKPYVLGVLGDDDGLSLLALHALGREDFHDHVDLKETGKQIVKKCARLPLAIKTIAGLLLHIPRERREWEDVLNNKKWAEESNDVLPALRLSYYHLPYYLKQLFAYCSIIPKDYIYSINDLVLLWMAEGLLQQLAGRSIKRTEDFGRDCFQELLSRSFFQLTSENESKFIMHDLINDLAVHVAGERYFRMDDEWDENREYKISERTRHLSFISQKYEVSKKFDVFNIAHRSRTILPLPPMFHYEYDMYNVSDTVMALTLSRLQFLRVLNLQSYRIVELPNLIGGLKHLRYLNLSYTEIKHLPQSVCSLYNLQTLSLSSCILLRELPSSISCLTNLRHLYLENTPKLEKMPPGIGNLTSLQTLSKIIVGRDTGSSNLKDLKDLIHLHGTLSIEGLQNVTDDRDVVAVDLRSREHLENVKLRWCLRDSAGSSRDRLLEKRVLKKLQPHCNLKVFHIEGYGGVGFPSNWVGEQSMPNVVKIHLHGCSKITHLPPLGELPLLKDLVINGMGSITNVGAEFYGNYVKEIAHFPSLETLSFSKMTKWNVWSPPVAGMGLFPRLRDLKIVDCRELGSITTLDLPFLCSLVLSRCKEVWLEILINLTSLKKMLIEKVTGLTHLPEQFVNSLVSLDEAEFKSCDQLGSLWRNNNGTSLEGPLNRLNRLDVWDCSNLISLLEEGELGLPRNLKVLRIWGCAKLEKLPNGLHGLASLQQIDIFNCPSLVWDMTDRMPKSLKGLSIRNCPKLESSITFLDDGNHSIPSVKIIALYGCPNIIGRWWGGSVSSSSYFASLVYLSIGGCPGVESFSVACFPALRDLIISDCPDLKSLPDGIRGLASLKYLHISSYGNLGPIGDKDLPPDLIDLIIWDVGGERKKEKSVVLSDWGFHKLTSLQRLRIAGFKDVVSFEKVVIGEGDSNSTSTSTSYLLPPSLTSLSIESFPNLESLSYSLENLTSLRHLKIIDCPKLESLAGDDDDQASLQIIGSLHDLSISGRSSEVLRKRCKKGKGKYWPTIQHIPRLVIFNN